MNKIVLVSTLIVFCLVSSADAVPVIQWEGGDRSSGNAIGILGLEVPDRGTYDVTFGHTFADVWGDPSAPNPVPTFLGDELGAEAAALAILGVFVSDGGVLDANDTLTTILWGNDYLFVPWRYDTRDVHYKILGSDEGSAVWNYAVWRNFDIGESIVDSYASFSPSGQPSPEPSITQYTDLNTFLINTTGAVSIPMAPATGIVSAIYLNGVTVTAPNAGTYAGVPHALALQVPGGFINQTIPPTSSPVIGAQGEDDYLLTFDSASSANGVGLITNYAAQETITFRDISGNVIDVISVDTVTTPNTFAFLGFSSAVPIKSVFIDTTAGASQNEVISAIYIAGTILNSPPTIALSPSGDQTVTLGDSLTFNVTANDSDTDDMVTLTATGVPSWATFTTTPGNPAIGNFTGTPTSGYAGIYEMQFTADDGERLQTTQAIRLVVTSDLTYTVNYEANTKPEDAPLPWEIASASGSWSASGGILTTIDYSGPGIGPVFYRYERAFSPEDDIILETRMQVQEYSTTIPTSLSLWLEDGVKSIYLVWTTTSVGFYGGTTQVIPFNTTAYHTYRIVKHGNLSVDLYIDNIYQMSVPYDMFWGPHALGNRGINIVKDITFGATVTLATFKADWDYIRYTVPWYNSPPELSSDIPAEKYITEGEQMTFNVMGTDPDNDTVTLTADGSPSWTTFTATTGSPATGTFTGTPTFDDIGTYTITFTADDGRGGQNTLTVTLVVRPQKAVRRSIVLTGPYGGNYTIRGGVGSLPGGSTVIHYYGDGTSDSTVVDENGCFVFEIPEGNVGDGFELAVSINGIESERSSILTALPSVPQESVSITGPDLSDNLTLTIAAGAVSGSTELTCIYPDGTVAAIQPNQDGSFTLIVSINVVGDGFWLNIVDADGNVIAYITIIIPPRVRLVTVSRPDVSGNVTVRGAVGSVTGGSIVKYIYVGGSGTTTANADGSFSFSLPAASVDTGFDLTVTVNGVESIPARVDRTVPSIPAGQVVLSGPDADGNVTIQGSPGFVAGGSLVIIIYLSGVSETIVAEDNGSFTFVVPYSDVADGFFINTTDTQGTVTTATPIQLTNPPPTGLVALIPDGDNITIFGGNDSVPPNSRVICLFGDGTRQEVVANSNGSFTITITLILAGEGFDILVVDASESISLTVKIILTLPSITVGNITYSIPDGSGYVTIEGGPNAVVPNVTIIFIFGDGTSVSAPANGDGSFSVQVLASQIASGFNINTTDASGTVTSATRVIVPEMPQAGYVAVIPDGDELILFGGNGGVSPGSTVTCIFSDGTTQTATADEFGSFTIRVLITVAGTGFQFVIQDAAGYFTIPVFISLQVEAIDYRLITISPPGADDNVTVSGGAGAVGAGETVILIYRNGTVVTSVAEEDSSFRLVVPVSLFGEGFNINSLDANGNITYLTYIPVVASPIPKLVAIVPEGDDIVVFGARGSVISESEVICIYGDGIRQTVTADADGSFSIRLSAADVGEEFDLTIISPTGGISLSVKILLNLPSIAAGTIEYSVPDALGNLTIIGREGAVAGGITVICIFSDGSYTWVVATGNGSFSLTASVEQIGSGFSINIIDEVQGVVTIRSWVIVPDVPVAGRVVIVRDGAAQLTVFGSNGSVGGGEEVIITYDGISQQAIANQNGSFSIVITVQITGNSITCVRKTATGYFSIPIEIDLSIFPTGAGLLNVSLPDSGNVIITGSPGAVTAGRLIICIHADGTIETTTANSDGSFSLTVLESILSGGFFAINSVLEDGGVGTSTTLRCPIAIAGDAYSGNEGSEISFDASNSSDPDGDALQLRWDFEGDGIYDTEFSSDSSTTHVYPDDFSGNVIVEVRDDRNLRHTAQAAITILNVPPTANAGGDYTTDEGTEIALSGSATDPGTDELSYAWDLDINTDSDGDSITDNDVDAEGETPTFPNVCDNGIYTVHLTVTDDDGGVGSATAIVTVNNVAPVVDAGVDQTVDEGATVSLTPATFTDMGSGDIHTAILDWGDGTGGTGIVNEAGGEGTVLGSHVYGDNGDYIVMVTVIDDDGGEGSDTVAVNVNNVAPTIAVIGDDSVDEGSLYTLTLGAVTDPGDDTITQYAVDWGDGNSDTYTTPGDKTHIYSDGPNNYTITVDLVDEDGTHNDAGSKFITVNNVAPTVEVGEDFTAECCVDEVTFDGGFDEPGLLDTHTYEWDFGDGTPDVTGTFTPTHKYRVTGNYTVTLTVTDNDEGIGTDTLTVTVVDTTPPDISITDVSGRQDGLGDNEYWNDTPLVISFSASDLCAPYLDIVSNYDTVDETAGTVTIDPYLLVGIVTVNITATDDSGNENTASVTFKCVSPFSSKQEVPASLSALLPTGDKNTDHGIEKAIDHVEKSLDTKYWETNWTLTTKAKKVFDEEKKSVHELMKLKEPPATVTAAINSMVIVDEQLAQTAINEAISLGGEAKYVAKAQEEMTKALNELDKDHSDKAIYHYRKAWEHAQKSMKKLPEPDDGLCVGDVKPQVLTMEYTGEGEDALYHSQDPKKVSVTGDPDFAELVHIVANDKKSPDDSKAKVWFSGGVKLYGTFDINATNGGEKHLKADTYVHILDESGTTLLQTVKFHTSGSQPLCVDNQFGGSLLRVFTPEPQAAPALSSSSAFAVLSAYPQPCNPETWIPYTLAKDVEVTITIYSISGRMIRTLQLGHQTVGAYISRDKAAYWNGRNDVGEKVSSGVYFYRLKAGDFIATKKLVVLR